MAHVWHSPRISQAFRYFDGDLISATDELSSPAPASRMAMLTLELVWDCGIIAGRCARLTSVEKGVVIGGKFYCILGVAGDQSVVPLHHRLRKTVRCSS